MSCHNMRRAGSNKKRMMIAIISGVGVGAAGNVYVSLAANPVAAAVIPAILAFAACSAMCAAMRGAMWLSRRFSKRKDQTEVQQPIFNSKEEGAVEVKTESIDSNQQVAYQYKWRKDKKSAAQNTCAISN